MTQAESRDALIDAVRREANLIALDNAPLAKALFFLVEELASVTEEWARGPAGDTWPLEMGSESNARYYAAESGEVVYKRLVGPWVEVE